MTSPQPSGTNTVTGDDGLQGTVRFDTAPSSAASATVTLADGRTLQVPPGLLQARDAGGYYLPLGPADVPAAADRVIPLVAEHLDVHKRRVETGRVRITKTVSAEEQVVDLPLERQEVTVERVPVDRFVTEPPPVRHEGDVTIIPLLEEVLVVEKRLMVREELRLTVHRSVTHEPRTVSLRKESAHVERVPAAE